MNFIVRLFINALVIFLISISTILPGFSVSSLYTAVVVAIVLAIVNVTLKPLLILLTLPTNILTLGLFTFVINAILLLFVQSIVKGFEISGFWTALAASLLITGIHVILRRLEAHQ